MKIGFGLIGTGAIAHVHAKAIINNKNSDLIGVLSSDSKRAEEFAKKYGIKAYSDYKELLKNPQINAVDIVNKNKDHADYGIEAAKAGKHVLVEKPIDIDAKKAELLIKTCKLNKVKLS